MKPFSASLSPPALAAWEHGPLSSSQTLDSVHPCYPPWPSHRQAGRPPASHPRPGRPLALFLHLRRAQAHGKKVRPFPRRFQAGEGPLALGAHCTLSALRGRTGPICSTEGCQETRAGPALPGVPLGGGTPFVELNEHVQHKHSLLSYPEHGSPRKPEAGGHHWPTGRGHVGPEHTSTQASA